MLGYRVPAPDEAMLISGGRRAKDGAPFRIVVGHGAFVMAGFRKARFISLRMQEAEVTERCVTKQGLTVRVDAVVAFKVPSDEQSIVNAGQRFLTDQRQMPALTGQIFAGHLRAIVGSMTLEEIITDRQKLAAEVLDQSKVEMAKLGLLVDSFQIQSVDDGDSGYIAAMSAPHKAAIAREAKIAQAAADQAAVEAVQKSQRAQLQFAQETAVAKAAADQQAQVAQANAEAEVAQTKAEASQRVQLAQVAAQRASNVAGAAAKAEVDQANASAAQAGPLAQAKAQLAVTRAQTEVAAQNAELRQRQLIAEVVRPAEAKAQETQIMADAEAHRQTTLAQALASSNSVQLEQLMIQQWPQVVEAAAAAFANANVTILNGAEGAGEMITGVIGQGFAILDALRKALPQPSPNGHSEHTPVARS